MPLSGSYFYPQVTRGVASVEEATPFETSQLSSSILGNSYVVVLGPVEVSRWNNFTVTLINNSIGPVTGTLESGSVEVSPNNANWEVLDGSTFAGLGPGQMTSSIHSESSYRYLRVRAIPSGSGGELTSSIDAYVTLNSG